MALVPVKNYMGGKVVEAFNLYAHQVGLVMYIKSYGYMVTLTPELDKTPVEFIEDSPNNHFVELRRTVEISKEEFSNSSEAKLLNKNHPNNIEYKHTFGVNIKSKDRIFSDNETGTHWFEHTITFSIKRNENESNEDYAVRIIETLTNMLINK